MNLSRLQRNEWIGMAGGLLLIVAVFVKWYEAQPQVPAAQINGMGHPNTPQGSGITPGDGTYSAWEVHDILRWLLIAAAAAPFILGYIIARDHQLSWSRGEVTMIVAIAAIGLIFYNGIIDRPGEPSAAIELEIGWYGAMLGSLLMGAGAIMRTSEVERRRKPPGTI